MYVQLLKISTLFSSSFRRSFNFALLQNFPETSENSISMGDLISSSTKLRRSSYLKFLFAWSLSSSTLCSDVILEEYSSNGTFSYFSYFFWFWLLLFLLEDIIIIIIGWWWWWCHCWGMDWCIYHFLTVLFSLSLVCRSLFSTSAVELLLLLVLILRPTGLLPLWLFICCYEFIGPLVLSSLWLLMLSPLWLH